MKSVNEKGFTLVELLLATAIMGVIAGATMPLLFTCLKIHASVANRSNIYQEGMVLMERLTSGVRNTTYLLIPNSKATVRNILAISSLVNEDNDYYFNDPLFPRVDEDPSDELDSSTGAIAPGIKGVDDDGDGLVDEGNAKDDDEDFSIKEDYLDGIDNDGDGTVDEDTREDSNADGASGIKGMDDDGDGIVDEGLSGDDDEDGLVSEDYVNPLVYLYIPATRELQEIAADMNSGILPPAVTTTLSTRVTLFRITYVNPQRILIELTLTGDDGKSIAFSEYVCPRNTLQKVGKKVR